MAKPTLHVIIIKMIADELRKKFPHLRIEGHPQPSPRLVVRNRTTENGVDVRIDVYRPTGLRDRVSGNPVIFFASLHKSRSKISWPHADIGNDRLVIDLDDEKSFDKFDAWIIPLIEKRVLPEQEPPKEPENQPVAESTEAPNGTTLPLVKSLWGTSVTVKGNQNSAGRTRRGKLVIE